MSEPEVAGYLALYRAPGMAWRRESGLLRTRQAAIDIVAGYGVQYDDEEHVVAVVTIPAEDVE